VSASGGPACYEIRVAGVLDGRWATWFDGLQIIGRGEETVICGLLADQPALHGLLTKVRDLGLCLISVRQLDTSQAGTGHHDQAKPPPRPRPGSPVLRTTPPALAATTRWPATSGGRTESAAGRATHPAARRPFPLSATTARSAPELRPEQDR